MTTLTASALVSASKTELLDDVLFRVCQILQLSATQYQKAEAHYNAICKWLDAPDSMLARFRPQLYPQGSVALGTTVKPQFGDEYDVDLVCQLAIDYKTVANPVQLLDLIEYRLRQNEMYAGRLERRSRCLRVNYEHDFHLDIIPACPDPDNGGTCLFVPDREEGKWRLTNPKGFVSWFKAQAVLMLAMAEKRASAAPLPAPQAAEDKNTLQLSVQLAKRWRDRHYSKSEELSRVSPASILLTTLMGKHYRGDQSVSTNLLRATQSTLLTLHSSNPPSVPNPSHPEENIAERWKDPEVYKAFLEGLREFEQKLADLVACEDMGSRSKLLQDLFGEKVTKVAFSEQARSIEHARDLQKIGLRNSGGIVSLSAAASPAIPRNTFYGDRRPKTT